MRQEFHPRHIGQSNLITSTHHHLTFSGYNEITFSDKDHHLIPQTLHVDVQSSQTVSHASMEQMWGSESRHMSQTEAPKVNLTAYVRLGESTGCNMALNTRWFQVNIEDSLPLRGWWATPLDAICFFSLLLDNARQIPHVVNPRSLLIAGHYVSLVNQYTLSKSSHLYWV